MAPYLVIVLVTGLFAAAATGADRASRNSAADDVSDIQGEWACAEATIDGKPLDAKVAAELKLVMTAQRYRTERGDEVLFDSTYRLDPGREPKQIDLTGTEGDAAGKLAPGIYLLQGDTLKICYTMPGGQRPK